MIIRPYALFITICFLQPIFFSATAQVDNDLTEKTLTLYNNLKIVQNSSYLLFGQEFFNSFKYSSGSAHGDKTYSDSHVVTGAYPMVLGSDFHYYIEKNATERGYHREAVKWAYQQGFVITFDWHISARNTASYQCSGSPAGLAKKIANEDDTNGDLTWFYGELDKAIDIINNELVVDDEVIPIVFRPFHEMNGNWFWWGAACSEFTPADYRKLYQLTVDYMKAHTNSVLFCWSPNSPVNSTVISNYYPGDAYVDVLGLDMYEITASNFRSYMGAIVDYAQAHNKIAVLSETGNRTDNGDQAARYWNDTVLPAIVNDPSGKSLKIAWALTWINSSWSYPYVPHTGSTSVAKQSFINFKNSEHIMFSDKGQNMYEPMVVLSSQETQQHPDFVVYPVPARGEVTVELKNITGKTSLSIVTGTGKVVYRTDLKERKTLIRSDALNVAGVYVMIVRNRNKTSTQKLIVY